MHKELGIEAEQTYDQANALETSLTSGAQNTYLGQLAAEGRLLDTMQQGEEAAGSLAARAGASGVKSGGTLADVLQSQTAERTGLMRKSIDSARETSMAEFGTQAKTLGKMRSQFDQGSAYMDLYRFKRDRVTQGAQMDIDYANKVYNQNKYNLGWFAADLFDTISAGASMYTAGAGAGWFGGASKVRGAGFGLAGVNSATTNGRTIDWSKYRG